MKFHRKICKSFNFQCLTNLISIYKNQENPNQFIKTIIINKSKTNIINELNVCNIMCK